MFKFFVEGTKISKKRGEDTTKIMFDINRDIRD